MSTTWKSLGAGFILGVVSTGLYAIGLHIPGAFVWGASVLYIGYQYYEASHGG
jgi:hypothetical protein